MFFVFYVEQQYQSLTHLEETIFTATNVSWGCQEDHFENHAATFQHRNPQHPTNKNTHTHVGLHFRLFTVIQLEMKLSYMNIYANG